MRYLFTQSTASGSAVVRLRQGRKVADEALRRLEPQLSAIYSGRGRPSIPPEALLNQLIDRVELNDVEAA